MIAMFEQALDAVGILNRGGCKDPRVRKLYLHFGALVNVGCQDDAVDTSYRGEMYPRYLLLHRNR